MSEFKDFTIRASQKASDDTHRLKILKAISTYETKVDEMKSNQFIDWIDAKKKATEIKQYVVENLPELLQEFEEKITANGVNVLWAKDKVEAQKHIYDIIKQFKAIKIVKSKSMTTEEIDFNEFCDSKGLEVVESDLLTTICGKTWIS